MLLPLLVSIADDVPPPIIITTVDEGRLRISITRELIPEPMSDDFLSKDAS